MDQEAGTAAKLAVDAGYRHFDTAYLYENEQEVGHALKEKIDAGDVKREDLFVVTKLWNTDHGPEKVEQACRRSCANLGLGYIDLYLMHWPTAFRTREPLDWWPLRADGLYDTEYVCGRKLLNSSGVSMEIGKFDLIFPHSQRHRLLGYMEGNGEPRRFGTGEKHWCIELQ